MNPNPLRELLASKKFVVALAGIIAGVAAKKGLALDTETTALLLSPVLAYIVGQGVADRGKPAAQALAGIPDDLLITLGVQALLAKLKAPASPRFRAVALQVFKQLKVTFAGDPDFN